MQNPTTFQEFLRGLKVEAASMYKIPLRNCFLLCSEPAQLLRRQEISKQGTKYQIRISATFQDKNKNLLGSKYALSIPLLFQILFRKEKSQVLN